MTDVFDPDPDPGLTLLEAPAAQSTAIHEFALATLETAGEAYWIDARNTAATRVLFDLSRDDRHLRGLRIARAFTAYQHHQLVRRVLERASPRTALVVVPNIASLYGDDDLADWEAQNLLDATLALLSELGHAADLPVVMTTTSDGDHAATCHEHADAVVECRETRFGHAFEGAGVETTAYRCGRFWQTTIPYWVDRCGTAPAVDVPAVPGLGCVPTGGQRTLEV